MSDDIISNSTIPGTYVDNVIVISILLVTLQIALLTICGECD